MSKVKLKLSKVCSAIEGKKSERILVLDIRQVSSFTDYFVLCHGNNQKHIQAIASAVREVLKAEAHPDHIEGYDRADWVLMDYIDFVVHIFSEPTRRFYNIEKLWSDGVEIKLKAQRVST